MNYDLSISLNHGNNSTDPLSPIRLQSRSVASVDSPLTERTSKQSEVLQPSDLQYPAPLAPRISTGGKMNQKVDGLRRMWNRYVSDISPERLSQATEINRLLFALNQNIIAFKFDSKQAKLSEKRLANQYPSKKRVHVDHEKRDILDTVKNNRENLEKLKKTLNLANNTLKILQSKENRQIVEDLVEHHARFDSLPQQIKQMAQEINHLNYQIKFREKLAKFEAVMADYPHGTERTQRGSWNQFRAIQENYQQLLMFFWEKNFKTVTPFQLQNPQLQNKLQTWIEQVYPDLAIQSKRLLKHITNIQSERMNDLYEQKKYLKFLLSKYHQELENIPYLEGRIADTSILGRIYRLFYSAETLNDLLSIAKEKKKNIYSLIKKFGQFDPCEVQWVKELALQKMEHRSLSKALSNVPYTMARITHQEKTENLIDQLIQQVTENDTNISSNLEKLANSMKGFLFESHSLPANWEKSSSLDQFRAIVHLVYPTMQQKIDHLAQLLKTNSMEAQFPGGITGKTQPKAPNKQIKKSPIVAPQTPVKAHPTQQNVTLPLSTPVMTIVPTMPPPIAPPVTPSETIKQLSKLPLQSPLITPLILPVTSPSSSEIPKTSIEMIRSLTPAGSDHQDSPDSNALNSSAPPVDESAPLAPPLEEPIPDAPPLDSPIPLAPLVDESLNEPIPLAPPPDKEPSSLETPTDIPAAPTSKITPPATSNPDRSDLLKDIRKGFTLKKTGQTQITRKQILEEIAQTSYPLKEQLFNKLLEAINSNLIAREDVDPKWLSTAQQLKVNCQHLNKIVAPEDDDSDHEGDWE